MKGMAMARKTRYSNDVKNIPPSFRALIDTAIDYVIHKSVRKCYVLGYSLDFVKRNHERDFRRFLEMVIEYALIEGIVLTNTIEYNYMLYQKIRHDPSLKPRTRNRYLRKLEWIRDLAENRYRTIGIEAIRILYEQGMIDIEEEGEEIEYMPKLIEKLGEIREHRPNYLL